MAEQNAEQPGESAVLLEVRDGHGIDREMGIADYCRMDRFAVAIQQDDAYADRHSRRGDLGKRLGGSSGWAFACDWVGAALGV
jgi:hypothetical protein